MEILHKRIYIHVFIYQLLRAEEKCPKFSFRTYSVELYIGKSKGKVHPRTGYEGPEGE
jgi:hypothetical protein